MSMDAKLREVLAVKGPEVVHVSPQATVAEAAGEMKRRRIGSVLVKDGERIVGVFTERDVLYRVVGADRDPRATRVGDVMTKEPVMVDPEMSVRTAMALMTERRLRRLPILEAGGVIGLVSIGDLTKWVVRDNQQLEDFITGRYPG